MDKKVIVIIVIAVIIVLISIFGVLFLISNDSLNESNNDVSNLDININKNDQDEQKITNTTKVESNESKSNEKSNKILIAYFSRADENYSVGNVEIGNTEIMAGFIKDYLDGRADTFKIDPVISYPADYKECTEYVAKEKNSNSRPEFKNASSLDLSQYDTIFIGYPIWWGTVPMIINTFLEKFDFSGKTIIPFNTHEGSGISGTYSYIKNKMTTSDVNTNGLSLRGGDARKESSRSTVEKWLNELGY